MSRCACGRRPVRRCTTSRRCCGWSRRAACALHKKRQPTAAARQEVAAVLLDGDFYATEDQDEYKDDAAYDLAIKAFAWLMIVQAAGLAQSKGGRLELTPAGRKALSQPAPDVIRAAWKKWRTSTLLDEFNRVEAIKGQGKRSRAPPARRQAVSEGLTQWPVGRWFSLDDFFRFLRAADRDFVVAHDAHQLYIAEHHYGNLGDEGRHLWKLLQGRYVLALLFEYAATMGLLDVAYPPPQGVRPDYSDRWGTDDLSCLSRYDGLLYAQINPLGAWCLGVAAKYEPPILSRADALQVLPNLDVVAKLQPLDAADRLLLDRFADRQSEAVWCIWILAHPGSGGKGRIARRAGGTPVGALQRAAAANGGACSWTTCGGGAAGCAISGRRG